MSERFLVTGALGCIGAWTLAALVREGVYAVGFDIGTDDRRLRLVLDDDEREHVILERGDITDLAAVEAALERHNVTHVVHLAALLIPLIKADPPYGALVNVVGTTNVFEAARRRGLAGVAYASSAAVYGLTDAPSGGSVPEDADGHPETYYGVHKQACEGIARMYWAEEELASVGLRPYVVFGPGRDTGLTAAPSQAMAAAALGESFHIPYGGRMQYHYAPDTAQAFVEAARTATADARVLNLGGTPVGMDEVVATIDAAAPETAGAITYDAATVLPFPDEFESSLGIAWTPFDEAVRETIEHHRRVARLATS